MTDKELEQRLLESDEPINVILERLEEELTTGRVKPKPVLAMAYFIGVRRGKQTLTQLKGQSHGTKKDVRPVRGRGKQGR